MSYPIVDYELLADSYDAGRQLATDQEAYWTELIAGHLSLISSSLLLDVGCGTGRFAVALAGKPGCSVVGLDPASGMLAQAWFKTKGQGHWLRGRAEELPFATGAFDACFMSQVLHHFHDKQGALCEAYRVLKQGGKLGVRFPSHEQLRARLDYRYFPRALDLECARIPDLPVISAMLERAGFTLVAQLEASQLVAETPEAYLAKLEQRYISVLTLLTEAEFAHGLRMAREELAGRVWSADEGQAGNTFLVARK